MNVTQWRMAAMVALASTVAVFFYACAGAKTTPIPTNGREVIETNQIGEDDAGKLLVVRRGDTFTLSLEMNGTAGYRWQEDHIDESGLRVARRSVQLRSDQVGSAAYAVWEFQAVASGEWRIELTLCQPWACADSTARKYELGVYVRPDSDQE